MTKELDRRIDELQKKMEEMAPGGEEKVSLIVFSGDLDHLLAAFIIATGTRAMDMQCRMFFTFWATAALRDPSKKGGEKDFLSRIFGFMLPKGIGRVKLSRMNFGGLGTMMMKKIMKRKKTASLEEMIALAGQLGVEIYICEMSMGLMGFNRQEMIDYPDLKYCGVASFLAEAKSSAIQLFI